MKKKYSFGVIACATVLLASAVLSACQSGNAPHDGTDPETVTAEVTVDTEEVKAPMKPYKDFTESQPYRITYTAEEGEEGCTAVIEYHPYYEEPFVLEIPETDEEGNPITVIQAATATAMLPMIMTEEDFAVFQGKMEAYYGLTYEEAREVAYNPKHPKYKEGFYLFKQMVFFLRRSLNNCKNDQEKAALLEAFPITEKMDVYVMDPTVGMAELFRMYEVARKAAPELDDVWYREACARTELDYPSGLGETMTEIRWPSQLSEIKELSFVGCGGLQTVTVPGTVKTVGEGAFAFCDALEEITFSEGVTRLSYHALAYCTQLKTVNLPVSLESIEFIFDEAMIAKDSERELPEIHYAGTMEQWKALFTFDSYFDGYGGFGCMDIHCSDGVIQATLDRN